MKLTYDPRYNIAYIRIKEKKSNVTTIHISEDLNIDIVDCILAAYSSNSKIVISFDKDLKKLKAIREPL